MTYNLQDIWKSLGTAWDEFQDKPTIETFWKSLMLTEDEVLRVVREVQNSRSLPSLTSIYNTGPELYKIVYSGIEDDLTVVQNTDGSFNFQVDPWVKSIPTIKSEYKYRGTTYSNTYTEGVHYTISGMNTIVWSTTNPTPDLRFSTASVLLGYAPIVTRYNPSLMDTWSKMCEFTLNYFTSYSGIITGDDEHLKYMIWGLCYELQQPPSIKHLERAFGIARGLPFAYEDGVVTTTNQQSVLGDYTYILPSGVVPLQTGTTVEQFDIMCSGATLWDYTTNSGVINTYANIFNRRNTLVYNVNSTLATIPYSSTYFNLWTQRLTPKQIKLFIVQG